MGKWRKTDTPPTHGSGKKEHVEDVITETIKHMDSRVGQVHAPHQLTDLASKFQPDHEKDEQYDAHECVGAILTAMSKQTQDLFTGEFSSKWNDSTCGMGISKCEPFLHVSLPVYNCDDLRECLQNFTSIEKLTIENGFTCKKCNTKVMAATQMTIRELPQILLIHLKLFNADFIGSVKIKKHVDFDLTINLISYLTNDNQCGQYDLCSVLVHAGESAHT